MSDKEPVSLPTDPDKRKGSLDKAMDKIDARYSKVLLRLAE